jgi:hypothetical protein
MATTTTTTTITDDEFVRKLEIATAGLPKECSNLLLNKIPRKDALVIIEYIISLTEEVNPSDNYRRGVIKCLTSFLAFTNI